MNRLPVPGEIYQHFKGNLYRIVTLAEHTEDGQQLVIYQALYGEFKVYARPLSMFMSRVDHEKYPNVQAEDRFTLVPAAGELLQAAPVMTEAAVSEDVQSARQEAVESTGQTVEQTVKSAAGQAIESTVSQTAEQDSEPEEQLQLDPALLAFLEADSYEEKLRIFASLAGRADESILNTIAVSMDLELSGDSLEEQYDTLKNCLLTLERYECNRLR